jgi:hypothetical protein
VAAPAFARGAAAGVPAGVIDARPAAADDRVVDRLAADVAAVPDVTWPDAPLADALAGRTRGVRAQARAARAEADARAAFADLRCDDATRAAEAAVLARLEADEAAPQKDAIGKSLAMMLLCADQRGDHGAGFVAAARLRALGFDAPPPGVSAELWARYPEVDALSNRAHLKVVVRVAGGGDADVWVDLEHVGPAPATLDLQAGRHWIVLVTPRGRVAVAEDVKQGGERVIDPPPAPSAWESLANLVAAWRAGARPDGAALAKVMRAAKIVLTVLVVPDGGDARAEVWVLPEGARGAVRVGGAPVADAARVRAAIGEGVARLRPPLVAVQPKAKKGAAPSRTWQYVFLGAVAAGTIGILLTTETGSTTQRIEVRFP